MVPCAYCERPLICDGCRAEYRPPDQEQYDALSRPEVPVACPECEALLVCHWCKTPYDGSGDLRGDESEAPEA
jgi:hypothetical protein